MATDPIHQFKIVDLFSLGHIGGQEITFTNSASFMFASVAAITIFLLMATSGRTLVPGRAQLIAEMLYQFVADVVRSTTGQDGMRFFPLAFTLFAFILMANLLGIIPYFFTVTSHIIVTAALALLVNGLVVGYGLYRHGLGWFRLFVPSGIPVVLNVLLVVPIEIISFLSRPFSLSLRLFANMLAGHIALKVFAGFIISLGSLGALGLLGSLLPFALVIALTALELLVAFLQAYVFLILTCIYLNDALHPGH